MKNIIIIDANFILLPIQFKIHYLEDIVHQLEGKTKFIIFQQVIDELKAKEAKRKRNRKSSKFTVQFNTGLQYLKNNESFYNINYLNQTKRNNEKTDDFLLRKAIEMKKNEDKYYIYLATNDNEIRKKAKEKGISTIYLRQRKKIEIN